MSEKTVFFSYSHDSEAHRRRVLGFSERLRNDGIDARLDQYLNGDPDQGWTRWMLDQLEQAQRVLVVCTETYYRRFRGHEEPGRGAGADFEGSLILQEIYDRRSVTSKFVPVMFDPGQEGFIPEPLRNRTHYVLTSEAAYRALYDVLLGLAGVEPGELGAPRIRPRTTAEPLTFGEPQRTAPTRLTHIAETLFGRDAELARLDAAWVDGGTNVVTLVAWGGVGKTSLVAKWAAGLAKRVYDGADYFDWSFYSQGTGDHLRASGATGEGSASADVFVAKALTFFGDPATAESAASPWDKGSRLAQILAQRRALLVLGGLEPLQYHPGCWRGG